MQLDPTRWLVSFAGFVVDWVMSREWKRIGLTSLPLLFLLTVAGLVFVGSRLDKHQLAARYLALGEQEIADWEASWTSHPQRANENTPAAPTKAAVPAPAGDSADQPLAPEVSKKDQPQELSRFAEVLFRRVQLLEPNERSQFVIGVTMAKRGAAGQAQKMLSKIAPDDRPGYAPAHAWIATGLLSRPIHQDNVRIVKHHVTEAVKWERVPESVLLIGSELFRQLGDREGCLNLLKKAAEINPANNLFLAQRSKQVENKLLAEYSVNKAIDYFRKQLEKDPNDLNSRLRLVQSLAEKELLEEAEQVIEAGLQLGSSPELTRGLSEIYRLRYMRSLKQEGETWSGDLQMLDLALRTDPTNAMVGEEIAKLARLNGKSPGDELIGKLRQFLAEGKATAATHAWIAELYLIRNSYAQAMPHLEQVVTRLPDSAQYLNNLAYVIAEIAPARLPEALDMAQRAVQLEPRSADYYDTLAKVLTGLQRPAEALAAIESAIERQPQRVDFHQHAIALYEAAGNLPMSQQHQDVIKRLAEHEAKVQAELAATESAADESPSAEKADLPEAPAPEPASEPAPMDAPTSSEAASVPPGAVLSEAPTP